MPIQLFPLRFKGAGFLRDGTTYQDEYCTEGTWVRFYQGKPKKIGGQKAILAIASEFEVPKDGNMLTSLWLNGNLYYFLGTSKTIYPNVTSISQPDQFQIAWVPLEGIKEITNEDEQKNILWQAITVVQSNVNVPDEDGERNQDNPSQTVIILFGGFNRRDINNSKTGLFYKITFETDSIRKVEPFSPYPNLEDGNNNPNKVKELPNLNGGVCFVGDLLFIYGTCGTVIFSTSKDLFLFENEAGREVRRRTISNDKVIYGVGVRGGSNPPTVLFWTVGSVVRMSNQSTAAFADVDFQVDVISNQTSILSSRCVVEYDGQFFWLGVDRIFLYNGIVREVVNNINFDWFFENLDIERRQLVFGIKNAEKGEIWWYFPVKGSGLDACSHALIYNIRENVWYDTPIKRDCGLLDTSIGKMLTYGEGIVPNGRKAIWYHEEGVKQVSDTEVPTPIPSSFTTPTFSLTAFNPLQDGGGGADSLISLERIEPDFGIKKGEKMDMVINTRYYASDDIVKSEPITLEGGVGKVDLRQQGRNISFTFSSENDFQVGNTLIGIKQGDNR